MLKAAAPTTAPAINHFLLNEVALLAFTGVTFSTVLMFYTCAYWTTGDCSEASKVVLFEIV